MKKTFLVFSLLPSFLLTSCIYKTRPETYQINGITIKTGFYGDLYTNSESRCFVGDTYEISDDLWDEEEIEVEDTIGVHISYGPYNMYSILFGQLVHYLYVQLDQFEQAKEYYKSYQNYHYYYAKGTTYDYKNIVELESSSAIEEIYSDVWNTKGTLKNYADIDYTEDMYYFYKISKDGLLTNLREGYFIKDNKLLRLYRYLDEGSSCYEIDSSSAQYLINLINK